MVIGKSIYKLSLLKYDDKLMNFVKSSKVREGNYENAYVTTESYGKVKLIKLIESVSEENKEEIKYKYIAIIDYENNFDTAIQVLIEDVYKQNLDSYEYQDIAMYTVNLIQFTNINKVLNNI